MDNNLYYKYYINKLIDVAPANLTLTRKIKTPDGYGGFKTSTKQVEIRGTFYDRQAKREIVNDHGITFMSAIMKVTKLLTGYEADIQKDDTFEHNGYKYKVIFVKTYPNICKQIEVEVIE